MFASARVPPLKDVSTGPKMSQGRASQKGHNLLAQILLPAKFCLPHTTACRTFLVPVQLLSRCYSSFEADLYALSFDIYFSAFSSLCFDDVVKAWLSFFLSCSKAILWTVAPNVRRDALLTKQARLIDLFRPVDIWHNVIVACKQSRNPDDDTQGALAAARHHNPHAEPLVLGYTFIGEWTSLSLENYDSRKDCGNERVYKY